VAVLRLSRQFKIGQAMQHIVVLNLALGKRAVTDWMSEVDLILKPLVFGCT
jgi:hypothetical protein